MPMPRSHQSLRPRCPQRCRLAAIAGQHSRLRLVVGDMEAQIAAARIGAERLGGLIERYGYECFTAACSAVMDYAERLMRQAIAGLPDGDYSARTMIDGFVDSPDPQKRHLPIVATVRVRGDEIEVDLTGTADQVADRPINMPFEGTVDVAVWLTVRSVLLDTAVCGHIPVNDGLLRPIKITAPLGSLANPIFPAPTIAQLLPRQPARGHCHEGIGASRSRPGLRGDRKSQSNCLLGYATGQALRPHGDFRGELRRARRARRNG